MLDKVKQDIWERSRVKNLGYFPQSGNSQHEFDYRYCTSDMDGMGDYVFVVSKYIKYYGNSIDDGGYKVYIYDKDGNYVSNKELYEKCRGRFYQTIKDI